MLLNIAFSIQGGKLYKYPAALALGLFIKCRVQRGSPDKHGIHPQFFKIVACFEDPFRVAINPFDKNLLSILLGISNKINQQEDQTKVSAHRLFLCCDNAGNPLETD